MWLHRWSYTRKAIIVRNIMCSNNNARPPELRFVSSYVVWIRLEHIPLVMLAQKIILMLNHIISIHVHFFIADVKIMRP